MTDNASIHDCLVIGAGPGGLQAAVYLGRYNRRVLLIDRGGGRTMHAGHIVNYLGVPEISGRELVQTGLQQVKTFGVEVIKGAVSEISKDGLFTVRTAGASFQAPYVIVSTGAVDIQPKLKNIGRFFGRSYFTCVDCDGHLTTGTKLLIMGNSINAVRLAFGMQQMYTQDISVLLNDYEPPADFLEMVKEDNIPVHTGEPAALLGEEELEGVELADGRIIPCEMIMATFGWRLNDDFLRGLPLDRDQKNFKIMTNGANESSLPGLYVVGALRPGHSQAIIAAGQGAVAAIDINHRLLEL